jgi:hypothetical protein
MRKLSAIALAGLLAASLAGCSRKPKTSCVYGDQIASTILEPVIQMGNTIAVALEQDRYDDIYNTGSELLKKTQTPEQFKLVLQTMKQNLGPLEFSRVREAFYLKNKAGKKFNTVLVPCSLGEEGINDLYQVPSNSEVVALIYSTMAGEENADIFIELIKQGEDWKLFSIALAPTSYRGLKVEDFVNLARKAREANKPRLAILYYKAAFLFSNLSPNVDEYVGRKIVGELAQVKADYIPTGTPQVWNISTETRPDVFNVDVMFSQGEPWVNIEWLTDNFDNTAKLEGTSEQILDFAFKNFPEYREFFTGIMVSARSQNPKLFNQVFRKVRRFSERPR